jgi:competence ComEA-like helix-hairpin-helix protein
MKKSIKSFISFSRTERTGLVCLCAFLVILIIIRTAMHLWVRPHTDTENEKKLVAAWEAFKRDNPSIKTSDTALQSKKDYQDAFDDNEMPLPNIINLNTADSATLVRLKGIGPATAHKIIVRRKKTGPFTDINQLKEVGRFPAATFEMLKKHLITGQNK